MMAWYKSCLNPGNLVALHSSFPATRYTPVTGNNKEQLAEICVVDSLHLNLDLN